VRLGWSDSELRVDILDRGPGVDAAVIAALGKSFVTTKQAGDGGGAAAGGLGIGFFLTNATIEGYGGEVEVFPREQGGTRTVVVLPLARLQGEDKA